MHNNAYIYTGVRANYLIQRGYISPAPTLLTDMYKRYVMKTIQLTQGKVTLVSDKDYEYLNQFSWSSQSTSRKGVFYAVRKDKGENQRMHRVIMNAPRELNVDHRDGDGLNNQRSNLRLCTQSQNGFNRSSSKGSSSKYKNVTFYKTGNNWLVGVSKDGKRKHIGYFDTELEAGIIANITIRRYHGAFAKTTKHQNQ